MKALIVGGVVFGAGLPSSAEAVQGGKCEFRTELKGEASVSDDTVLRLFAGSGFLEVKGRSGLEEVRYSATACASDQRLLDELAITLDERGSGLFLEAKYPDTNNNWRGDDEYARLDLLVEVPLGMEARIEDGSGELEATGLGELHIVDGSGGLTVEDVRGDLIIRDGSGEIDVRGVSGDFDLVDGSGSVKVEGVAGSFVFKDGSGSVDVYDVAEDVRAAAIGSGTLTVRDIGGDLVVREGRNERIRHSGVQGSVDIPAPRKRKRRGG